MCGMKPLSREHIRAHYDELGSQQDSQSYYEDPATDEMILHAAFPEAQALLELGCGTGRFAKALLAHHVSPQAEYVGLDLSATMIALTRTRLSRFAPRAQARVSDGLGVEIPSNHYDRVISNYVFDLLSEQEIHQTLSEAHRILQSDGLLCLVSLSKGCSLPSRFVAGFLAVINRIRPSLLGGCRPLNLVDFLAPSHWKIHYSNHVISFGISSQILVAVKKG